MTEPEACLTKLFGGLKTADEELTVKQEASGSIVLMVKGSDKVLEFLGTQRIEPFIENGYVTIELRATKSKNYQLRPRVFIQGG